MENKMIAYLSTEYDSDNHVLNFLRYWKKGNRKSRPKNDMDCIYFSGDLRADTLFSVRTPLNQVLKVYGYSTRKKSFDELIEMTEAVYCREDELLRRLNQFALQAEQRCNYFLWQRVGCDLWPGKGINAKRGVEVYDQVPATFYRLFHGEQYSALFENDDNELRRWIHEQRLEPVFKSGAALEKQNIRPLIPGMQPCEYRRLTDPGDLLDMLDGYCAVLELRKTLLSGECSGDQC